VDTLEPPEEKHGRSGAIAPAGRRIRCRTTAIEITGTSTKSVDEAVNGAIARASKTLRDLREKGT
jgi:hypothetical protein